MSCGTRKKRRGGSRRRRRGGRKVVPWAGWHNQAPGTHQRTVMLKKCGRKCFLGPKKSFPICTKGTCKKNTRGIYAAYVRARQWGKARRSYKGKTRPRHSRKVYQRIARNAKRMLKRRGALRTRKRRRRR